MKTEEKDLSLILDTSTRWNSTLNMINRALKVKRIINFLTVDNIELKFNAITNEEWDEFEEIKALLKPFDEATTMLSGSTYPTLCNLGPILGVVLENFKSHLIASSYEVIRNAASDILVKLEEYSILLKSDLARLAMTLDPRNKALLFDDRDLIAEYTRRFGNDSNDSIPFETNFLERAYNTWNY